jgi:hypothetical protein
MIWVCPAARQAGGFPLVRGEMGPMATERVSVRRVLEILRLKHECGASVRLA